MRCLRSSGGSESVGVSLTRSIACVNARFWADSYCIVQQPSGSFVATSPLTGKSRCTQYRNTELEKALDSEAEFCPLMNATYGFAAARPRLAALSAHLFPEIITAALLPLYRLVSQTRK